LVKVRDVMTKNVPHVDAAASVLEASKAMNQAHRRWTGVVVLQSGTPVGMVTERSLLRRFIDLNKRPQDVKVDEVMAPLLKISADAPASDAIKKMLQHSFTRLSVFDNDKLVGWVTLTDIARLSSKEGIIDMLRGQSKSASDFEALCPSCRSGVLVRVTQGGGKILRWQCPKCGYEE